GHYFLLNIECNSESLKDIESLFKFEESIMRSSIVKKKRAETEPSSLFTQTQNVQKSNEIIDQTAEDKKPNESKNNSKEETNASSELESSESDKE
ncbi:MAG: 30S ribosomal protein S6, partial [Pseudomonadota bacterium]|nr:30S ribosomal protein S6 [Pseudomonadota bacterium]